MLHHEGDSRHTQNIQGNKIIGENENVSFILQKKPYRLFGQPNTINSTGAVKAATDKVHTIISE